jgi:hypothetical protein
MIYAIVPLEYLVNDLYANFVQLEYCNACLEILRDELGDRIMDAETDKVALDLGMCTNVLTNIIDNNNCWIKDMGKIAGEFELNDDCWKQQNLTKEIKILRSPSIRKQFAKQFKKCVEISNNTKVAIANIIHKNTV